MHVVVKRGRGGTHTASSRSQHGHQRTRRGRLRCWRASNATTTGAGVTPCDAAGGTRDRSWRQFRAVAPEGTCRSGRRGAARPTRNRSRSMVGALAVGAVPRGAVAAVRARGAGGELLGAVARDTLAVGAVPRGAIAAVVACEAVAELLRRATRDTLAVLALPRGAIAAVAACSAVGLAAPGARAYARRARAAATLAATVGSPAWAQSLRCRHRHRRTGARAAAAPPGVPLAAVVAVVAVAIPAAAVAVVAAVALRAPDRMASRS